MKFSMPQLWFSKLLRAVTEFQMIDDDDTILIGVSGGKDSLFLSYAMAMLRERLKKDFALRAITIDPMFHEAPLDTDRIAGYMKDLDIPYEVQKVDIAGAIDADTKHSPCYTCAYFRRGAVNRYAVEHGCQKVAYAHHNDDAVETLFMGLLWSGQISTFTPKTYLSHTGVTVIRPLIYLRESETIEAVQYHHMKPVKNPCPNDGKTIRQDAKELLKRLGKDIPDVYAHVASAMRKNAVHELWPPALSRKEMQKTYFEYMYGKK